MTVLAPSMLYRLAWNAHNPILRGAAVAYQGPAPRVPWDVARARVKLLATGELWDVTPGLILRW